MIASHAFVTGLVAAGYLFVSLLFLRFWRRTRDKLFAAFAAAFALMAVNQAAPVLLGIPNERMGGIYLLRLAAFLVIIWAVLIKNAARKS